jgi:hypothetical protein
VIPPPVYPTAQVVHTVSLAGVAQLVSVPPEPE